jgi:CHAD domain-containing protein
LQGVIAATQQEEIERTYDVGPATVFPTLVDDAVGLTVGQPVEHHLEAVYFDTAGQDLTRLGWALRRRTGDEHAGWRLLPPGGDDGRTGLRRPPGQAGSNPPAELLEPVRAVVRDRPLLPVARLTTRRREYPLLGREKVLLAHVRDDEVEAQRLDGGSGAWRWREWKVQVVDGDRSVLDSIEPRLLEAGAAPAATTSRLAGVLGETRPVERPSREDTAEASAADLVRDLLAEETQRLQQRDAGVRADAPDSVHKLRISARRLRSALTTYRPLFEPGATDHLRDELRWLGQELAAARDAQVLREHLHAVLAAEPPELVIGPVAGRIDDELRAAYRAGLDGAHRTLDSERYFRLLDALDELVGAPPFVDEAQDAARDVLPRLLARDAKRLRRAVRDGRRAEDAEQRDLALHEARKKAKRLRYAAESAVPVFGARAKEYAARVKKLQQTLGVRQDTVAARRALRSYGVSAHLSGANAFTFGRLHGLEQARSDRAERAFLRAWKAVPHKGVRDWILG